MQEAIDDNELLAEFAIESQRQQAFRKIIDKYQKRIYWHIRKIVIDHDDTDDLTQDTFIKAWNALPEFRQDSQLYTWLYRIATNEALNFLRKKKNRKTVALESGEYDLSDTLRSSPYINGDKLQLKLQHAILTVPEKQRLVFNMKYFDAMKYEDMSTVLDTSVGALKASYHHAVKKIEAYFENER
jgi:RNA polymerase sigma factor (sigma-70 family)